MFAARVLDVILVLLLVAYLAVGWRSGFARTLSTLAGTVVGAVLAFLAIPLVAAAVPSPEWRSPAAIAAGVGLLITGHAIGTAIGSALAPDRRRPLAAVDRLFGGVLGVVAAALASSLVLGSVGALGAPVLSRAVAESTVLRAIESITPAPVESGIARLRAAILQQGIPSITEALGGVTTSPGAPPIDSGNAALDAAALSVVRIGGTAYACGQNQSGSGFVVSPDRVVTNAHVVAGVASPVVEAPGGQTVEGRVVYFDAVDDLAVIATDGLDAAPLALTGAGLGVGDRGAVDGYPYGGPFTRGGAEVLAVSTELVSDIYSEATAPREVYTLAAVVEPGNSGGPLLALDGTVAGVVFAESSTDDQLGYAMTNLELTPVAEGAPDMTTPVAPGRCARG